MGQKSLNFSVSKCVQAEFPSTDLCQLTYKNTQPSCHKKLEEPVAVPRLHLQPNDEQQPQQQQQIRRRFTTEELSRWVSKFSKAKIASRKHQDLRRQVLLHNALIFAKSEIAGVQKERMQRWKELKPLFHLETTTYNPVTRSPDHLVKMASVSDKMAADPYQMATDESEDMDQAEPRPATPLPSVAAFKRNRCGCSAFTYCQCRKDASRTSKKFRPSSPGDDDDEDLKSLDQFLSSLHFDWESIYSYQMCPTD